MRDLSLGYQTITSYLDELFPNVQFIVTAHSPLVVQGSAITNVAVLRRHKDQVEILNDPEAVRGWRVDQILTSDLFGLESARPKDIEDLLDDPSDAEREELRKLDAKLAMLAPGETARDREAWSTCPFPQTGAHESIATGVRPGA
jgi:hypothetical protein